MLRLPWCSPSRAARDATVRRPVNTENHDHLLTEDGDATADTYDSDADCCRLRRRRALSTGDHVFPDPYSLD